MTLYKALCLEPPAKTLFAFAGRCVVFVPFKQGGVKEQSQHLAVDVVINLEEVPMPFVTSQGADFSMHFQQKAKDVFLF